MDPLSITLAVVTLTRTTIGISSTFSKLATSFRETPALVDSLFSEYTNLKGVIQRLEELATQRDALVRLSDDSLQQARQVIGDTETTLKQLHNRIRKIFRGGNENNGVSSFSLRCRFLWNEREVEAMMQRLRARQQSLSLVLQLWSNQDTTSIRTDLLGIRATLENGLQTLHMDYLPAILRMRQASQSTATLTPSTPATPRSPSLSGATCVDEAPPSPTRGSRPPPPPPNYNARKLLQSKAAPVAEKIQDLIRTLAAKEAACPGLLSAEIASTSQAIGKAYRDFGQLDKALTYYYKALEAREIVLGEAHSSTLNTLDNIAAVFVDQTRYEEALDCYKQCLEKREATTSIGSNHPSALANKLMVGKMLSKLGQCDGALERLSQVHERYQSTIGATHLSALAALTEVATVQQKMGHRTSALINFRKVLEGRESVLGADHALTRETTQVISTLENQSNGEARENPRPVQTLDQYASKLDQKQRELGRQHPETLELMFEMACAYSSNQKYSQAIPWFKQALAGRETILGKKHPLTLLTHHELAGSYVGNNELNQASMHFHTALEGREEVLGPEHPETLKTIHEIARLNSNQGDFHTALALYRRVCDERERKFGSSHESTLTSKHNLATAFKRDAKYAQALEVFAEVRRERLQSLGRSHPSTLGTTHEMASVYYFRKSYGKAIELAQEARAGREEKFGPLHSWTVASAMLLGNAYLESGNTEEALRFLKQGLTGYKHLPDSDTEVFATTCNIATIYRTRKEPAEALKWYLEALELGKKGSKGEDAMPSILDNIADLSEEVGKLDQALDFHQRAFGAKLKSPPQSGRSLQQSRFHIGRLQLGRGLHEQALVCFRRLLSEKDLLDKDLHIGTLVQICNVYALQDKIDESLETLQELLDLCRTEYGEDGELTKQSKRQMAAVYLKRQNRDNAFNEYEQALNWLQTEFDRDDPLTISFLCKVAASHYQQNMYSESISLYRAALEALDHNQENANHEIKELTLTVTSNIAAINSILGKYDKSLEYHQRALQLRERNCDANDPSVLENMHRIAALHVRKGSYEQALQTLRQVQHREVTTLGPRDPKPLTTLRCIGDVEGKCGRYEVALTCYQRALAGLEAMLDPNDTEVLITLHGLSGVHFSLGNVTACRTALERATASMERSPALGPGNLETLSAMQDLASLYDYLEQGSNALVWWKKALDGYRDKLGENHPSTRKASERVAAGPGGGDGNAFGHD